MALSEGKLKSLQSFFLLLLVFVLFFTACKDKKKDSIFTTDDVNPNVKGNVFLLGEKGYSITIPRLFWIVVKNTGKTVDLTLNSRSYPASVKVFAERTFKKNISIENAAQRHFRKNFIENYSIIEKNPIEIAQVKGLEYKAIGEVKIREYKSTVPRIITCSLIRKNKFTYRFTFICKPEEYDRCYEEFVLLKENFQFEKITPKPFDNNYWEKYDQANKDLL